MEEKPMSKKGVLLLIVFISILHVMCAPPLRAEPRAVDAGVWEAGVLLGEPTGFSLKFWTTWDTALDLGLAWSFSKKGYVNIHADYLFHKFDFFEADKNTFPIYFGVGGRLRLEEDDPRIGIRISIGLEYVFKEQPIALFFEIAPIVDIMPETEASMNGGIGVRFIF
jgi:hypothetical protein